MNQPRQNSDPEELLLRAAVKQVDRLITRSRRDRIMMVILAIVVAVSGFLYWNQHQANIHQCEAGNAFRVADEYKWDVFVGLLTVNNHDPHDLQVANHFLNGTVAASDAQRNCSQAYSIFNGG